MARPLRQDYPGATHHVFVRGVARSAVAVDAIDYERTLSLLERVVSRFELRCHAWCLLPNHSHLLVTSRLGNLSRAMHWLGTSAAQSFNQRHERSGHLYQGRFGSRLVADDSYLLELARYVPLNPSEQGCASIRRTGFGRAMPPLQGFELPRRSLTATCCFQRWAQPRRTPRGSPTACSPPPWTSTGSCARRSRPSLATLLTVDTDEAIAIAHFRHGYSMCAIANCLGVNHSQISRRLALHG